MPTTADNHPRLIVTADDYGYSSRYSEGILRAAKADAIDATSAMVLRGDCDPRPLSGAGVEVGLHLELDGVDGDAVAAEVEGQLGAFRELFGEPPAYLDGHHHSHATPLAAGAVAAAAAGLAIRVRSVDGPHRILLRAAGVTTPARFVGRSAESEPLIPAEVTAVLDGAGPPAGTTEWMTHPGLGDSGAGSAFDAGRELELAALLRLAPSPFLRRWRGRG